ncbi:MAG: sigma-70 family RNA polymerase sigma factor, partial [Gemmatimonadetes bacterium]|nr:sigma-70 family RNA polymerase sigma factor [Gemmatimonadota bacterium]
PHMARPFAAIAPLRRSPARSSDPDLPPDFEAWFRDHREAVYRFVRFRVATREIAEDITSEVFLKALRSLRSYDSRLSAPRTWLFRIARNAVTDHLRALRRHGSRQVSIERVPDPASQAPSQEDRMLEDERKRLLMASMATLRQADQEILSLRYGADLGNREIAESLGITANAVAVRIHRALERLRTAVAKQSNEDG